MTIYKPMAHQQISLKFIAKKQEVFDQSDPGCVSADTEFLTPTGWKRIDKYSEGEQVAQFYPDTREIEFVTPLAYVKKPCDTMIAIAPVRGTSQRLSPEHRVLFYRRDGSHGIKSAAQFMQDLNTHGPYRHNAKFCSTYSVRNQPGINLDEWQIRLMIAVIADGHFPNDNSDRCVIRVKKTRKINRLFDILVKGKIPYSAKNCGGADPEFKVFTFTAPWHDKEFGDKWWDANQTQLEIIADELCYWDSSQDARDSNGTRFSTLIEKSADFAQYAFAAAKRPASVAFAVRDRRDEDRGMQVEFNVHAQDKDKFHGPGRKDSVFTINNHEGFKYCFEVPTSFLLLRHNGHIFATGNTGKTLVEILDFAARHKKDKKAALILCPKSLMRAAWFNDIVKFAPHLRVSLCYALNREASLNAEADVYVVNIDGAKALAKITGKKFWSKFGTMIIDESTSIKHQTSQRSKAVAKIRQHFAWVRLLSGTAACNGICDLWHQYFVLDKGKRLGKSFFGFRSAVCDPIQNGPGAQHLKWEDKPGIELVVAELVKDITIRHRFEDCVDIPPNHRYTVSFALSKKHEKMYQDLRNQSLIEINKTTVSAINKAVLAQKLLQCASGAIYSDDGGYALLDNDRYNLVLDLVEERQHSIVFYTWDHQLEELVKEAKGRNVVYAVWDSNHPEIEQEYQAGKYQVLFAHPQSAGHGLTLTKGTATIWASPTHNLEHFLQGYKRIYRIGQKQKTETIMVIAENTDDERAFTNLNNKNFKLSALLSELE